MAGMIVAAARPRQTIHEHLGSLSQDLAPGYILRANQDRVR